MVKMTAKEMFENLGYQKIRDSENSLIYDKADILHYYQILFNKNDKTVSIKYNHLDWMLPIQHSFLLILNYSWQFKNS